CDSPVSLHLSLPRLRCFPRRTQTPNPPSPPSPERLPPRLPDAFRRVLNRTATTSLTKVEKPGNSRPPRKSLPTQDTRSRSPVPPPRRPKPPKPRRNLTRKRKPDPILLPGISKSP